MVIWNAAKKWRATKNKDLIDGDLIKLVEEEKIPLSAYPKLKLAKNMFLADRAVGRRAVGTEHRGCYWLVGKSGSGKSRYVHEKYPDYGFYKKMCNKWWDNYIGEDVLYIEDIDKEHAKWICYFLKIWSDRYRFKGEVKGGVIEIEPFREVYVSSNWSPERS